MSIDETGTGAGKTGMGTRILLVEDDPGTQDLIRALCEGRGDSVDTAADGFLGLRLLSERRHEVVLIDYHLPEMDGYALARLMRELARPEGRARLVGITADRHGLASRRGADTLFDAILVKPLDPQTLFATLDRLTRPEPSAPPMDAAEPTDAIWRRRGLSGRPRALLCPPPSAAEAEAVAQAFALAASAAEADIVLVSDEAGLDGLRDLRAEGPAGLLPSFDLTGRLGAACDGAFQIGDPDSWTALARTSLAFAERRALLLCAAAQDPTARLAALMFVADRGLRLATGDEAPGAAYETGYSKTAVMAAVLQLIEVGALTCEPLADGIAFSLTQGGRATVIGATDAKSEFVLLSEKFSEALSVSAAHFAHSQLSSIGYVSDTQDVTPLNLKRQRELEALVGPRQIDALLARLSETLDEAFAPGSEWQLIARQAHTLISTAGSLGFDHLSEACRVLEDAISKNSNETKFLGEAKRAVSIAKMFCLAGSRQFELAGHREGARLGWSSRRP